MDNEVSLGKFIEDSYFEYGLHKNLERDFNQVYDGLKPVYRRVIYTYYLYPNELVKSAKVVGTCMGSFHPHGDKSIYDVAVKLVNYKICDGQGNWGYRYLTGESSPAAAMRYTEAKLSPIFRTFFDRLIDIVPKKQSPADDLEPEYLPTPIPICLLTGSQGIGIGANQDTPAFDFRSLYEAWKNNDPTLLRGPEGLELDLEESELDEFWNSGKGRLSYKLNVSWEWSGDAHGSVISGNNILFNPDLSQLEDWRSEGLIFRREETSKGESRIFYARNKGVRKVSDDDIHEACIEASKFTKYYRLNVSDTDNIYTIPLKDWLGLTISNYVELLKTYRQKNIERIEYLIEVNKWLPEVLKIMIEEYQKEYSDDEEIPEVYDIIHEKLGISYEIITSIGRKSISTLKKTDSNKELDKLKKELSYFESFNPVNELDSTIKNFGA